MPCRDYEDDRSYDRSNSEVQALKKQNDRLARIACKAMQALEELEKEDFLLLKDDEVRDWWLVHKEADRQAQEALARKKAKQEARAQAMSKLTNEEQILLGLKKR